MKLLRAEYVAHECADLAVALVPDKFSYHYKAEWVLELAYHLHLARYEQNHYRINQCAFETRLE